LLEHPTRVVHAIDDVPKGPHGGRDQRRLVDELGPLLGGEGADGLLAGRTNRLSDASDRGSV
jgi:hypothetical protein